MALVLVIATLSVYLQVFQNELVNYDDDHDISQNPNLAQGLTAGGLKWAFTDSYGANWYPLTWLSLMLDIELFGIEARAFHGTNLVLHAASVVLLFALWLRMTGALGRSAFVAALFGVHPLHVESVAWAAERKDVLSGLFFMLTLLAYARYARRPGAARLAMVALFLALGLMSKPMLVSVPFVLLLLDVWPLERAGRESWKRLLLEKVPLFLLVALSSAITFFVQRAEGAVQAFETYSLTARLSNALVSYLTYVGKAFWPSGLSPYYPHPGESIPWWQAGAALAALAASALAAMFLARRRRELAFLPVGLFWYLGMLVPVIGIVQVGQQAMADRYTYLPSIGLSVAVAFGAVALGNRFRIPPPALAGLAGASVLGCALITPAQVRVWRDSVTLFEHALAVTENNALAHINLGVAYLNLGRLEEASIQLQEAIRLHAGSAEAHRSLAAVRSRQGRTSEALDGYRASLRLDPGSSATHRELGVLLLKQGDSGQALVHFREASALAPGDSDSLAGLALALSEEGRVEEAEAIFREASSLAGDRARVHYNWGLALLSRGESGEALRQFGEALAIRPDYVEALVSRGRAALGGGDHLAAVSDLREAVRLAPENEEAQYHLGLALAHGNELDEAFGHLEKARSLNPGRAETYYTLGLVFAGMGEIDRAAQQFRESLSLFPANPQALYSLGLTHAGRGELERAIDCYQRALELAPDYAEAYNSWGVALATQGRMAEAVERFETALGLDPRLAEAHNNLGMALARRGATEEAIEHFRAAIRLEPGNPDGYNNLGVSLAKQGKLADAAESFRRAIEIAPHHPSAGRNLENALRALEGGAPGPGP